MKEKTILKLLDCTLRDGGYYTNWDFSPQLVDNYIQAFNNLPIEYLEVGYRSLPMDGYLGEFFYCPVSVLERLKAQSNKKLVIILNEKDVRIADAKILLTPIMGLVDMVRLAVDPINFKRALNLGEEVKRLGFELSLNVMYMSTWATNRGMMGLLPDAAPMVDYFYMVDSFGGVFPTDVKETIDRIRNIADLKLGFHGHNNLELALINSLTAIEEGVEIIDATITGMGRGAGNLKTELLLTVLNAKGMIDLEYNELSKVVDSFSSLQQNYGWGTNLPYMVSGANSLPQKNVMEWVTKRFYSFNAIIRALSNQSKGIKDNQKFPLLDFEKEKQYETALIIGGGKSVVDHLPAIKQFLQTFSDAAVIHASSKNATLFEEITNDQYFCLVGNEGHRLEAVFGNVTHVKGKCVLPAFPRKMGTYVPSQLLGRTFELREVDFTSRYQDSHSALAIQSLISLGVKTAYFTGYDGYSGQAISEREQELFAENEFLFSKGKEFAKIDFKSVTPTKYTELLADSVYAYI